MTSLFARRVAMCIASVAAVAAAVTPATASASKGPKTDLGEQCAGASIVGRGSTFQNPAQLVWQPGFTKGASTLACSGTQGSKGTPQVEYRNTETADRGSGACLKAFGAEKEPPNRTYSFCGTDEAPNPKQAGEIESHEAAGGEAKELETIPVLQGAVAVIVHLPEGCVSSSEPTEKDKVVKLGRLSLDGATLDGIYRGEINTWKQVVEAQHGDAKDAITCKIPSEEEDPITRVVRTDHSGTTHIFKEYLGLVDSAPFEAEKYEEAYDGSNTGCHEVIAEEKKTWAEVAEGCENQRWPAAAQVVRSTETGNPGVIKLVNSTASSIGYADLAVAREDKFFSTKTDGGGENKKGEANPRFWAPIQNSSVAGVSYADPSSKGDNEKLADSNCKNTDYIESEGHTFPPESTRDPWYLAKANKVEENYPICGLTYDLAFRQYKYFGFTKETATTVENYLLFEVSSKGGGKEIKNHDYEALPKEVVKKAEAGIKEIGWAIG